MVKRKERLSEGKKNIIADLIREYDIQSAKDIQDALKDLLGGTIESMLAAELENRKKQKQIRSKYGEMTIDVSQDRNSSFEPKVVKKRQKDISNIENKIISMYAKGLTTRQISDQVEDIYGFEVSEGMVSDITDRLLPEIEDWQQRLLSQVYPIVYIDSVHFSVRDNHVIKKLAAYVILGINEEGKKEVISIQIGQNESSKYWLSVLNELKNRGVRDILILCADGLSGIKESINVAFPNTEYQRCIVHQVRNTLKYVADKDKRNLLQI